MSTSPRNRQPGNMIPILRAIAKEIVERSAAIVGLEQRLAARRAEKRSSIKVLDNLTPRLAVHRRELNRAEKELRRLGWNRDPGRPMRFLFERGSDAMEWQPEGTNFYRSLEF